MQYEVSEDRHPAGKYLRTYNYLLNTRRGAARTLWLLFLHSSSLGIVDRGTPLVSLRVRSCVGYRMMAIAARFLWGKFLRDSSAGTVLLPDRGHVALFCFPRFVRIFDLEKLRISNICSNDDVAMRERFGRILRIQDLLAKKHVAPSVFPDESTDNSYVEELCIGTQMIKERWWKKETFDEVCRKVRTMQGVEPAATTTFGRVAQEIDKRIRMFEEEGFDGIRDNTVVEALRFLLDEARKTALEFDQEEQVDLYLSHGDLGRANALMRPDSSIVLIDWQTVDYRTKDYDMYGYFFDLLQRGDDRDRLADETLHGYLCESVGAVEGRIERKEWSKYKLFLLKTRLEYFLMDQDNDRRRLKQVLDRTKLRLERLERCKESDLRPAYRKSNRAGGRLAEG